MKKLIWPDYKNCTANLPNSILKKFGAPTVEGAAVTGKVLKNGKSKKVIVYKMHPKKGYRRKQGHRQPYTKVQITGITLG